MTDPAPTTPIGSLTLRGTIERGAAPSCVLLRTATRVWLLVGAPTERVLEGQPVEVIGVPLKGIMTHCQSGAPLQVTSISPT